MIDRILTTIVICLVVALFGYLARPASSESLPIGVTFKNGAYYINRKDLNKLKLSKQQMRYYGKLARENGIEYHIIGGK